MELVRTREAYSMLSSRRRWVEENVAALDISLSAAEIAELECGFPVGITSGLRYPEPAMKQLGR